MGHTVSQADIGSRLPEIDGLRGFAALYLMAYHTQLAFQGDYSGWVASFFTRGADCVQLFFVISGFVIYRSLSRRAQNDPHLLRNFMIRRMFRILPLWFICLGLYFIVKGDYSIQTLLLNMTFLFGFVVWNPTQVMLYSSWTLFVEETFYYFLLGTWKFLRHKHIAIFATIASLAISALWQGIAPKLGVPTSSDFLYKFPLGSFPALMIGMCVAAYQNELMGWISRVPILWLELIAWLFFFRRPLELPGIRHEFGPALLLLTCLSPRSYSPRFLCNRLFLWAGVRCYAIYISYPVVHLVVEQYSPFENNMPYTYLMVFSVVMAFAWFSWEFLEKPWMKVGQRLQRT